MNISIGLDKVKCVVYSVFMQNNQKVFFILKRSAETKKEAVNFVKNQFKQLIKKNLSIPVTLYHL